MKKMMIMTAMLVSSIVSAGKVEILPPAQKNGTMSLQECLNSRHTVRKFKKTHLTTQQLADMLWCANGVNRPNGKRTAPSALDKREVMIYVALPGGAYLYTPEKHELIQISSKDLRKSCGNYDAPCYLILVPDRKKQSREIFAAIDTGYVSQNIYLAAQANNLGTCAMGSISNRKALETELSLNGNTPLLVHPVGIPE